MKSVDSIRHFSAFVSSLLAWWCLQIASKMLTSSRKCQNLH